MVDRETLKDTILHVCTEYAKQSDTREDAWVSSEELSLALQNSPVENVDSHDLNRAIEELAESYRIDVQGPREAIKRERLFADGCEYRYNVAGEEFLTRFGDGAGTIHVHVPEGTL